MLSQTAEKCHKLQMTRSRTDASERAVAVALPSLGAVARARARPRQRAAADAQPLLHTAPSRAAREFSPRRSETAESGESCSVRCRAASSRRRIALYRVVASPRSIGHAIASRRIISRAIPNRECRHPSPARSRSFAVVRVPPWDSEDQRPTSRRMESSLLYFIERGRAGLAHKFNSAAAPGSGVGYTVRGLCVGCAWALRELCVSSCVSSA